MKRGLVNYINMKVFKTIKEIKAYRGQLKDLAFVPTMGALHEGHLSLIELAKRTTLPVAVSIFVNPLQFNDKGDFEKYPRNIDTDLKKLSGVDFAFVPDESEILGDTLTKVSVSEISTKLEGEFRPGHFDGVSTIVATLFNILEPSDVWFGEKDLQQVILIERMVKDLKYNINIHRAPIIREPSGLALSSRNERLSAKGKIDATEISKGLFAMREAALSGEKDITKLKEIYKKICNLKIEYIEVVEETSLDPCSTLNPRSRALTAVWCEGIRLIDNVALYV